MDVEKIIREKIAPIYRNLGMELQKTDSGYRAKDADACFEVEYDIRKVGEVGEDMDCFFPLENAPRFSAVSFRGVFCWFNMGRRTLRFFAPEDSGLIEKNLVFEDDASFEAHMTQMTAVTVECVIPYFEELKSRLVSPTYEMYHELSKSTQKRAAAFAEAHHLGFQESRESLLAAERILTEMFQNQPLRELAFYENEEEIIDLAAFCGEVLRQAYDGKWGFFDCRNPKEAFDPASYESYGVTIWENGDSGDVDVLSDVLIYWNLYPRFNEWSWGSFLLEDSGIFL